MIGLQEPGYDGDQDAGGEQRRRDDLDAQRSLARSASAAVAAVGSEAIAPPVEGYRSISGLGDEMAEDRCGLPRQRDDEEMAAVHDLQPRVGIMRVRIRPLTRGTIGSSWPITTSVGCLSVWSQKTLVHPASARS